MKAVLLRLTVNDDNLHNGHTVTTVETSNKKQANNICYSRGDHLAHLDKEYLLQNLNYKKIAKYEIY